MHGMTWLDLIIILPSMIFYTYPLFAFIMVILNFVSIFLNIYQFFKRNKEFGERK